MLSGEAESANSRIVGYSLGKSKDVQFDEEGHRPPLLSPEKKPGLSDDKKLMSPFLIQVLLKAPDYSLLLLYLWMDHGRNNLLVVKE
ncbi:MAG: hypothetical protein ACI90V_012545 [Bacillariaceae sp.]|jgi:hypothetical protein